jgi:serine/threonine-protein kinase RsbT
MALEQRQLQSTSVTVESDLDIVIARQNGRLLATQLGFSSTDSTLIATAISELARNIILYAKVGFILLATEEKPWRQAIVITAKDEGPGISDIAQAMKEGFSTSGSLGLGLSGVKRLMDEFEIVSKLGHGTTVTAKKWRHG